MKHEFVYSFTYNSYYFIRIYNKVELLGQFNMNGYEVLDNASKKKTFTKSIWLNLLINFL